MAIQPDAEKATDKLMQMLGHTSLGMLRNIIIKWCRARKQRSYMLSGQRSATSKLFRLGREPLQERIYQTRNDSFSYGSNWGRNMRSDHFSFSQRSTPQLR
jgi:hypothetical protein